MDQVIFGERRYTVYIICIYIYMYTSIYIPYVCARVSGVCMTLKNVSYYLPMHMYRPGKGVKINLFSDMVMSERLYGYPRWVVPSDRRLSLANRGFCDGLTCGRV